MSEHEELPIDVPKPESSDEAMPDTAVVRVAPKAQLAFGGAAPALTSALTSGLVVSTGFAPCSGAGRSPTQSCV